MANMVMDLNPDDDDLPADYLENYDVHGRPYVNKKLRKKIAMHIRLQEAREHHPASYEPRTEWRPKTRKPRYKILRKVMAASDITSFIQNTTADLMGLKISEAPAVCPDEDWPISDAPHLIQVRNSSHSFNLSQVSPCPDQLKKKSV
jgi:hypothetical protein